MGIERTFQKTGDAYTTTNKKNGFLISTSTWKLSADGNTLVIESKGTKSNGDTFDNVTTNARTAPGTGSHRRLEEHQGQAQQPQFVDAAEQWG